MCFILPKMKNPYFTHQPSRSVKMQEELKQKLENANYEPAELVQEKEMIFPEEVWQQFSNGRWCFGCSNCNCN